MSKPKVLLIQEDIKNYRDHIYKLINNEVDLTVAYTLSTEIQESTYRIIKFPSIKIGKVIIHRNIYDILNQYDVVINLPHLKFVWLNQIAFFKRKFKLITWSIGLHVSYNRPYDLSKPPSFLDRVFEFIQDRSDACIFYMPEPIEYWVKYKKINREKYFVAHNTVEVEDFKDLPNYSEKDSFLFIGTLYKQKGLDELLYSYAEAIKKDNNLPILRIVGKGPEEKSIKEQIESLGLQKKILLCGPIYDEKILKELFFKAIICISPKQAGLSVLKSLGYGVPFITQKEAITGGEKTNITNGINGIIYESTDDLTSIMLCANQERDEFEAMSKNAREYYLEKASPQIMAKGVLDAIKFVLRE